MIQLPDTKMFSGFSDFVLGSPSSTLPLNTSYALQTPAPPLWTEKPENIFVSGRCIIFFFTTSATWEAQLLLACCLQNQWASLVAQMVKNLPTMQETRVQSLGSEDPLEKGTATHSCILAWRIPWTEEPGWPQSMGLQRAGHD